MTSLNYILWGGPLGDPDDGETGDGTDTGTMPQWMQTNCMAMCCSVGDPCGGVDPPPCSSGRTGCI